MTPEKDACRRTASGGAPMAKLQGPSQFGGTSRTGRLTVDVDPTLGPQGMQKRARDLLSEADRVVAVDEHLFGTSRRAVNVIVCAMDGATDGSGGADHRGCDYTAGGQSKLAHPSATPRGYALCLRPS